MTSQLSNIDSESQANGDELRALVKKIDGLQSRFNKFTLKKSMIAPEFTDHKTLNAIRETVATTRAQSPENVRVYK